MNKIFLFFTIAVLAAVSLASPVLALVKFDFEQKYFLEPPEPVLDHSLIFRDGVYHLFYLRGNPAVSIGHATSSDLKHWEIKPPQLAPGSWDELLWAPMVYERTSPNYYLMFYTGVNSFGAQQSGIALSSNLDSWFKYPYEPVYNPDPVWAEWGEQTWCHGRDPHVVKYNGTYYMFVTAKTEAGYGAVACAVSNDLFNWTDMGPLYVHSNWHVLESVFIKPRNGKWHMFFTEETIFGTSHVASDDLLSGWNMDNRRVIDNGHAPEIFDLPTGEEIFSRHNTHNDNHGTVTYTVRFDTLQWIGEIPAAHKPWALGNNWTLISGDAFTYQPVFGNNPYVRDGVSPKTFEGNSWIGTYERYTGPMGFGFAGGAQGDAKTGVIRSKTFTIVGNSMSLLVGGGEYPDECYVRLVDVETGTILFSETGKNSDELDTRRWNVHGFKGREVYIEIADLSSDVLGRINVDSIEESYDNIGPQPGGGIGIDGKTKIKRIDPSSAVGVAHLYQNAPNPFNPVTTLAFEMLASGHASIEIYDVSGRLVTRLFDDALSAGYHSVQWDGADDTGALVSSGMYFYRLSVDGELVATRRMTLLK